MNRLVMFINKHKMFTTFLMILLFLIPLFAVHTIYKIDLGIDWLKPKWSAGDVLSYIIGFLTFLGTVLLSFLALWQNHKIHEEHIESLEPQLTMNLIKDNNFLYLIIENTGGVGAKNIKIDVLSLSDNGEKNELYLDGLFNTEFELYPNEKARGRIAIAGNEMYNEVFPKIRINIRYVRSDLNRKKEYERTVICNSEYFVPNSYNFDEMLTYVRKIGESNLRIANYLDGHQIAIFDEMNLVSDRSLQSDLYNAFINKEIENIKFRD